MIHSPDFSLLRYRPHMGRGAALNRGEKSCACLSRQQPFLDSDLVLRGCHMPDGYFKTLKAQSIGLREYHPSLAAKVLIQASNMIQRSKPKMNANEYAQPFIRGIQQ